MKGEGQGIQLTIEPSVRVPRPACDWAVHDCCPEETEDKRRKNAPSVERAANHDHDRAGAEQKLETISTNRFQRRILTNLIQTEDDVRQIWRGSRISHDILHTEMRQVADKRASSARIREREAPEHPLKRGDGNDHQGLEQHGQRRLPARKAAIQEAEAGNDQPDDEAAEDDVGVVELVAGILQVHVFFERVAAIGLGLVEGRLLTTVSLESISPLALRKEKLEDSRELVGATSLLSGVTA